MRYILRLYALALTCCLSLAAGAQRYTNPVLHLDYSDPDVCRVGEDYYMTASSFNCMPGLPILHSRDLVHWTQIGYALGSYPAFDEPVGHGKGVWAPSIRWHDGWFYIFCGDPDRGIFMVRSREPQGPWSEPVWVVHAKGFIDPCPLWDTDGSVWLVHGSAGSRAGLKSVLYLALLNPECTSVTGPSRIIYDGHITQPTIEGPKMYKRDGWYYIFSPAGGVATGWQTVLRARSIQGPYEERIVMAWAQGTVNGPHQGGWVETPYGDHWFLHFQDKGAYGRIVHLQPMKWLADGWPVIGSDPDGDGVGQPVADGPVPRSVVGLARTPATYSPYGLPLEWQFQGVPSPYWYYATPDGVLRLYSVEQTGNGLWNCANLLSQKFPAEAFTVEATMSFMPNPQLKQHGEKAGFVVTGNSYAGLQLVDCQEGIKLQYVLCEDASKGAGETLVDLCTVPFKTVPVQHSRESGNVPPVKYPDYRQATVRVRLEVEPTPHKGNVPDPLCRFSYSLDGTNWVRTEMMFIARPELWIGARFGFYCNRDTSKNDSGWLDILNISVFTGQGQ